MDLNQRNEESKRIKKMQQEFKEEDKHDQIKRQQQRIQHKKEIQRPEYQLDEILNSLTDKK